MASPAASSPVVFLLGLLLLYALSTTSIVSADTITVTNNCSFTLWPAAIPVGGGLQLNPGGTWTLDVPVGTTARIWGRTGCSFNGSSGHCATGDCAGALNCTVSGSPPLTAAEVSIGGAQAQDFYDISIIDGYNLAMSFSCSTGVTLRCTDPTCPQGILFPDDDPKLPACQGGSTFQVTFCP
ncbi:hypothetical protein BS78_08G162900 [Paspalum vaginatum]|nr:hypothetical protein BS78_08G162900 [Paspalum vaginatum]